MWSMNTNKYLGGALVVAWLLLIVDFVGDQLVPPVEPVVATASAAATPLLLRVIKPIIKKATDFFKKKFGKKVTKPTRQDIITDEYRKKKGLPPRKPTS